MNGWVCIEPTRLRTMSLAAREPGRSPAIESAAIDLVLQDYERTGFRASKEVFRVENGWLRAVGIFEDQ